MARRNVVFYHASCADGFGAAFAAYLALCPEPTTFHPVKYGQIGSVEDIKPFFNPNTSEERVYILDFSFPHDVMLWLMKSCGGVVWLDHHKTAFEMWCNKSPDPNEHYVEESQDGKVYIELDNRRSGALITWDHFHGSALNPVPSFITHIDDYDRWQFKVPHTKEFNKALWARAPWSFEQWNELFICNDTEYSYNLEQMYAEGAAILRAHETNVQSVVQGGARECVIVTPHLIHCGGGEFDHFRGFSANCPPHLTSDVGHELSKKMRTYGLCWTLSKEGLIAKCSLRSEGDFDVSAIAKAFGGGGHRNAAGFEVSMETLLSWMYP